MRTIAGQAMAWIVVMAAAAAITQGCASSSPTEIVPGVSTQMAVPRDLDGLEVEVQVNHTRTFCQDQYVNDGYVDLPRTLGVVPGASAAVIVTIIIRGFSDAQSNPNTSYGCQATPLAAGVANGPAIVRSSTQTYVAQHTLYLPMPLSFSCFDADCSSEEQASPGHEFTCKGGACVDVTANDLEAAGRVASTLVDFTPSLIDGTDICFSPSACFVDEVPAVPVDAEHCVYGFPEPPPFTGMNVRIFYQAYELVDDTATGDIEPLLTNGGEEEILDNDPVEGFCIGTCGGTAAADSGTDAVAATAAPADGSLGSLADSGADATAEGATPDARAPGSLTDSGADAVAAAGTTGRTFQLSPGLCDLVHRASTPPSLPANSTYVTISGVHVASACAPKVELLPICASERVATTDLPDGGVSTNGTCNVAMPLLPTPSAAYLVMDNSAVMHSAFGPEGAATDLSLSLTDPVFSRTSAAFTFLSHDDMECPPPEGTMNTTAYTTPQIAFGLANSVQSEIAAVLDGWTAPDTAAMPEHLDLLAAMRSEVAAYAELSGFFKDKEVPNVAAAMFFVNRVPDPTPLTGNDCQITSGTADQAVAAAAASAYAAAEGGPSLQTYFVVLANDAADTAPLSFYQMVQSEAPQAVTTIDATSQDRNSVVANFSNVVTRLATCLYEVPLGVTDTSALKVAYDAYVSPGVTAPVAVPLDPTCNVDTQNTSNGWNIDSGSRLRICGQECTDLRTAIVGAAALALGTGQPAPEVPVTATLPCAEGDGGDGG